jgi:CRISPR/Cas system-associated endonuclease Cas3-HD
LNQDVENKSDKGRNNSIIKEIKIMEQNKEEIEIIEIEVFAKERKPVPKQKRYRIRIDKELKVVEQATITGKDILALVGKTPQQYNLYQHFHKAQTEIVPPEKVVDLTAPGVERFTTMKIENTEG